MKATAEISLYPLSENYAELVTEFILRLRDNPSLKIETNGLSTQIFGEADEIFSTVQSITMDFWQKQKAVLVMKIAKGELTKEELPEVLR